LDALDRVSPALQRYGFLSPISSEENCSMGRPRFVLGYLFVTFALTNAARAGDSPDPLRLIPDQADFFLKIERPVAIFETIEHHPLLKELEQFDTVRELFDSTNSRRFSQL